MATSTPSKRNAVVIADTVTVSGNVSATDLTLSGNLTVSGTTTTLNTATLQVEDKNIVLNYGTGDTSASADGAGITIQDAVNSSTNAAMTWNASSDLFNFSHKINVAGDVQAYNFYGQDYHVLNAAGTSWHEWATRSDDRVNLSVHDISFNGVVRSTNNLNVDGPNFNVSTTNKSTSEYAYRVDRSGTVVGGIRIDGRLIGPEATINGSSITSTSIGNWNTAYGWGNHASAGYLTSSSTQSKYLRSDTADTIGGNLTSGNNVWIRFAAANATDTNDGKIGAGIFSTGLNIVGAQTSSGTGRQVRIWGEVITDGGNKYWHAGNDGSGSGLDADKLDGQQGSFYQNASNLTSGSIPNARINTITFGSTLFNNKGQNHTTITNFNTAMSPGPNYIQSYTNGPESSGQWYGFMLGLGADYGTTTGSSGHYASQMYYKRNASNNANYLYMRSMEGGSWGSWLKVTAGYADSAGTATSATNADTVDNLHAASFLRSDASDTHAHTLTFSKSGSGNFMVDPGGVTLASVGTGDLVLRNLDQLRFQTGNDWDWNKWAGIKYDSGSSVQTMYIGGPAASQFNSNSSPPSIDVNFVGLNGSGLKKDGNVVWHAGNDGSGSGLDADTLDGLQVHTGRNNVANRVVRTDGNGYIQAGWINTTSGATTNTLDRIYASNDGYIRYVTPATLGSQLSQHINYNNIANQPTSLPANGGNADTVDSLHASSFIRSDAADTATGTITFSNGINVGDITNGGITGSNYNISGVNNITMNDPGEGISFAGTTNVHLYAIDDSTDSIMNFASASEVRRNNNKMWDAANDGSGSGLDADLLDGVQGSGYLRSNADDEYGSTTASQYLRFNTNSGQYIASGGSNSRFPLQIYSPTANGGDAAITFHIGSDYAGYFGLASDWNDLAWGGWSVGSSTKYRIWHSGNDGSGTGLDADTLDGVQGSSYLRSDATDTMSGGINFDGEVGRAEDKAYIEFYVHGSSESTYYPVTIQGAGEGYAYKDYSISRRYNWTAPNSWNTSTHKGGLTLTWQHSGDTAWGGNDKEWRVIQFDETYTQVCQGLILATTGGMVVWLRGGGSGGARYRLHSPRGRQATVTIYDGTTSGYSGAGTHSSSTTFTAGNGDTFSAESANTTTRDNRINPRWPVRDRGYLYHNGNAVWHTANDGSGSGLDADTVDGVHEGTFMRKSANSSLDMNNYVISDFDYLEAQGENRDVKYSVWSGTTYGIGMTSGVTLGHLNDYAMTFCMNNDSDRGFWWGYSGQGKSAGAMSLTTGGKLWVTSDVTSPNYYVTDTNTRIHEGGGNSVRVTTNSGYIEIGPHNTSHAHIQTDRSNFYFNKELRVDSGIIGSYDEDLILRRASNSNHQIQIGTDYISTTRPLELSHEGGGSATNGGRFLHARYSGSNRLAVFSSQYSTGHLLIGNGMSYDAGSNQIVSTFANFSDSRTGFKVSRGGVSFLGTTGAVQTAVDSAITTQDTFLHQTTDGYTRIGTPTGTQNSRLAIYKADNDVADHIMFYNGNTRVGEIGVFDNSWLRINQSTAKNIYTPRMLRADGGFQAGWGTAAAPGIAWQGDTNTGLYRNGADNISFTAGGTTRAQINTAKMTMLGGTGLDLQTSSGNVRGMLVASETAPHLRISTSGNETIGFYDGGTSGTLNVEITGAGTLNLKTGNLDMNGTTVMNTSRILINTTLGYGSGGARFQVGGWIDSSDGNDRFYFASGSHNYYKSAGSGGKHIWRNSFDVSRAELDASGNFIAEGNITAYGSASDIRIKENIEIIPNSVEKVKSLRGVTFNYKKDGKRSTGLIAQELQKVLPEAVYETKDSAEDGEDILAIRYGNVVGLLVEAIKEQQTQIDNLTALVNELKEK